MANRVNQGLSTGNWRTDFSKLGTEAALKGMSSKATYLIQTSREYRDVTDSDIDLRRKYGKSLVSNYTGTDKKFIRMDKKISTQGLTTLNEVYYIYLAGRSYGKLAISIQRTFRGNTMTFILTKKVRGDKTK